MTQPNNDTTEQIQALERERTDLTDSLRQWGAYITQSLQLERFNIAAQDMEEFQKITLQRADLTQKINTLAEVASSKSV